MEQHGERAGGRAGSGEEKGGLRCVADEGKGIREWRAGGRVCGLGWRFRIRVSESAQSGPTVLLLCLFPRGFVLVGRDLFTFGPSTRSSLSSQITLDACVTLFLREH